MGWNYRTQEMPCAFTRSQLRRLDGYNAVAQRNAAYLTAELGKIPGLVPPYVPPDRPVSITSTGCASSRTGWACT